jgi:peptide/nickel transport system permease protein
VKSIRGLETREGQASPPWLGGREGLPHGILGIARRLATAVPLLLVISGVVFALIHAAPGGPTAVFLSNPGVRPEDIERLQRALGLDQPLWVQYLRWLGAYVRGDWGYSMTDNRAVLDRVLERAPATFELTAASLVLALILTLALATLATLTRSRWPDATVRAASAAGLAIPAFWFGLLLQLVFAASLGWLPSSGRVTPGDGSLIDRAQHLVLPAVVLAGIHAAAWTRYLRASMIAAFDQPFVMAARARGVNERGIVLRHVLRTALVPLVSVVLLDAALLVSGAVVTESVFAWPGLGTLFTEALARRDYAVLMAMVMLASAAVVAVNLVADLVYTWLDPRVTT